MNISRINSLGNKIGITTTFLLGRIPRMRISISVRMNISRIDPSKGRKYLSSVRMNISRIYFLGKHENESAGEKKVTFVGYWARSNKLQTKKNTTSYWVIDS